MDYSHFKFFNKIWYLEYLLSNSTFLNVPDSKSRGYTTHKMKFSIKDFFRKCEQIRWKLRIWSHLLKKSLMEISFFV